MAAGERLNESIVLLAEHYYKDRVTQFVRLIRILCVVGSLCSKQLRAAVFEP